MIMKKLLGIVFLGLMFNYCISVQAFDSPKNYLKGKFYSSVENYFLVATKKMRDPRFKNTVIIMLENDEKGARGFVINNPLASIPLGSLIYKSRKSTNKQKELFNVLFANNSEEESIKFTATDIGLDKIITDALDGIQLKENVLVGANIYPYEEYIQFNYTNNDFK